MRIPSPSLDLGVFLNGPVSQKLEIRFEYCCEYNGKLDRIGVESLLLYLKQNSREDKLCEQCIASIVSNNRFDICIAL